MKRTHWFPYAALVSAAILAFLSGCIILPPGATPQVRLDPLRDFEIALLRDPVGTPPDDAGDYSFVRQAIPVLLGRKVRGYDELKVFVDLIRATDRATFVRILTDRQSPFFAEYVSYWSDFFVDRLRVHRETEKAMPACFTPRRGASLSAGLAACLASAPGTNCRGAGTDGGPASDFNMGDVLRSAVAADALEAAYRAHLFALVAHPPSGAEITQLNKRDDLGETFGHVYVHRNLGCLGCHTTNSSVSGEFDIRGDRSYWNRHFPVPGAFELALFGTDSGRDPLQVHALFRTDITGATRPWQMSDCGSFIDRAAVPADAETAPDGSLIDAFFTRPLGRTASVWNLEDTLRSGAELLRTLGLRRDRLLAGVASGCTDHCVGVSSPPAIPEPPAGVKTTFSACALCHSSPAHSSGLDLSDDAASATTDWLVRVVSEPKRTGLCASFQYLIVPGNAAQSCLNQLVQSDQMPPGGTSAANKTAIQNWINGLPAGAGCDPGEPSVCAPVADDNPAAFAFLTAMNIVDQVWEEVMGNRLNIANYFPRNQPSRDILQNLTETVFVPNQWSLRALLVKILTSEHFNRRAPEATTLASGYAQHPVAKPFEVNDPRFPPEAQPGWTPGGAAPTANFSHILVHLRSEDGRSRHRNAVSDGVYRYSANNLLRSAQMALGWPAAPRFASASYPTDVFRKALGQFYQDAEPGFRGVGFQSLLAWEAQQGLCANKNPVSGGAPAPDWVTRMVTALASPPSGVSYTNRDVAIAVRDWLLGDGTIERSAPTDSPDDEEALLAGLYGNIDANVNVSTPAARGALESRIRKHCGALLESPQFLLAGLAPEGLGPQPKLRACVDSALCRYRQICAALAPAVRRVLLASTPLARSVRVDCSDDCVVIGIERVPLVLPPDDWLCPRRFCTVMPGGPQLEKCLRDPMLCMPRPPVCRPGCAAIDCCGGPLPPLLEGVIADDGQQMSPRKPPPHFNLAALEGAIVELAQGVQLYRREPGLPVRGAVPLEKGVRLRAGDWLEVALGAQLRIVGAGVLLQSPKGGAAAADGRPHYLQVTGESVVTANDPASLAIQVPRAAIKAATQAPKPGPAELRLRRSKAEPGGEPRPIGSVGR